MVQVEDGVCGRRVPHNDKSGNWSAQQESAREQAVCATNAIVLIPVDSRGLETRAPLHRAGEPAKVRLSEGQLGLVLGKVSGCKVRAKVTTQALRVVRDTAGRPEVDEVVVACKGAIRNTSSTRAAGYLEGVAGITGDIGTVPTEPGLAVKDGRVGPLVSRRVEGPVPVRLRALIVALIAQHVLIDGAEEAVPGHKVAGIVDREGLLDVRVDQIIARDDTRVVESGRFGRLGQDAFDRVEVVLLLRGRASSFSSLQRLSHRCRDSQGAAPQEQHQNQPSPSPCCYGHDGKLGSKLSERDFFLVGMKGKSNPEIFVFYLHPMKCYVFPQFAYNSDPEENSGPCNRGRGPLAWRLVATTKPRGVQPRRAVARRKQFRMDWLWQGASPGSE